jgi:hypothetical protein
MVSAPAFEFPCGRIALAERRLTRALPGESLRRFGNRFAEATALKCAQAHTIQEHPGSASV